MSNHGGSAMSPRATRYYTVAGDNYPTQALVLPSDTLRLPNTLGITTCFASCYKQRAKKMLLFWRFFCEKKKNWQTGRVWLFHQSLR